MSSAVIYQNIAASTPFVAAIGIGAGLAFYLYFRYTTGCEEKEHAREAAQAELNNIEYIIRRDNAALPKELQGDLNQLHSELAKQKSAVMAALEANDPLRVEQLLAALATQSFEIRRKLADEQIAARETESLIRQLGDLIMEQLSDCRVQDQETLRSQLEAARTSFSPEETITQLEALRKKVARSVRLHGIYKGTLASAAEERFIPQQADAVESRPQQEEIERFHLLLKGYDETAYAELSPLVEEAQQELLPQRLGMIRDMVKLRYGTVKEATAATLAYRSYISDLERQLRAVEGSAALVKRAAALLAQRYVTRAEYNSFSGDAARHLAVLREEALLITDMQEKLAELGYTTSDEESAPLAKEEPLFFDTRWDEYKVLVRIGAGGELVTRLARVVASEREKGEITDYQHQRDTEVARSWCHDFDSFIDSLQAKGYAFKTVIRKEPEQEGVICIVDTARAAKRSRTVHVSGTQTNQELALVR